MPREMLAPAYAEARPWHDRFRSRDQVEEVLLDAGLRHVRTEIRQVPVDLLAARTTSTGSSVWATGRFVREMLGELGWEAFMARAPPCSPSASPIR